MPNQSLSLINGGGMNTLSKENYDKLKEGYLYKCEPVENTSFYVGNTVGTYHCKNWTFKVYKNDKGEAWMLDTYFSSFDSHNIKVTDDNFDKFEVVFAFADVERIHDSAVDEYEEKDRFCVATDSGGYSCGHLYWKLKGTEPSIKLRIKKSKDLIESLERKIVWEKETLEKLYKQLTPAPEKG